MEKREALLLAGIVLCGFAMLVLVYKLAGPEAVKQILDSIEEGLANAGI